MLQKSVKIICSNYTKQKVVDNTPNYCLFNDKRLVQLQVFFMANNYLLFLHN